MKCFLTILAIICMNQMQARYAANSIPEDGITLTGTLIEEANNEPLPYATVVLYDMQDSVMISNTITEFDGSFELKASPGHYYCEISFVGYDPIVIEDLLISENQDIVNLGQLTLLSDAQVIDEIIVTAQRSQMELKLDKRVFNVGQDLTNKGNSAAEILDNVPSVTVDAEGNVSLRGSQGVRILVNGKPSGLLSSGDTDALLRMQGDIIQSVEVITNPSAKYEAEGEAGIINIVLKKNEEKGVNGSFGLTLGWPGNAGGSYNLNVRRKNFNLFSNFGIDYRKAPGGGFSNQKFLKNGQITDLYTTETDQTRGNLGAYFQFGTDWNISEKQLLTSSVLYRAGKGDTDASVIYRDLDANQNILDLTTRNIVEDETDHNLEASLDYTQSFDKEGQELTITTKYIINDDTETADYAETSTLFTDPIFQQSNNTEDERNFLFQADYAHPFGEKTRIEGGLRAALRSVNNDFIVRERAGSDFFILEDFDDQLNYNENIYAAYGMIGHEFSQWSFQAGLRGEISDITASLIRSGNRSDQNYINLFPSVSLSYKLDDLQQVQLSYSSRLSRPYFRRLLPFSNFNNPRSNRIGNPNLLPEFTDSYEISYLRYMDRGSFLAGVYYRNTENVIEELTIPAEDGTSIRYPINLSTRNAYGVEMNFSYDLTQDWDVTTDVNVFRSDVSGAFEGTLYKAETFSWSGRINSKVDIGSSVRLQGSFNYRGSQKTTQGRRLPSYSLNMAGSVDVLGGNGTITLSARDLLNTRIRRTEVNLPDFQSESEFQWRQTRSVVLSFNYRLNQEKRSGT